MDIVSASFQLARAANEIAWGLYNFFNRVKGAPSSGHQTQHALVALKNCLDKIQTLGGIPLPIDEPQNESLQSGINAILDTLREDLKRVKEVLQIEKMLSNEESFWKTALYVYKQSFKEPEVREIFDRIEKYERLLQTHFEMCILLSSTRTQNKLDAMSDVLQRVVVRLFQDAENIEPASRIATVRERGINDGTSRYLGAFGLYQDASMGVAASVIGAQLAQGSDDTSSTIEDWNRRWDDAPSVMNADDEAIDMCSPVSTFRRWSDDVAATLPSSSASLTQTHRASKHAPYEKRHLEILLQWHLGKVDELEEQQSFGDAAEHQKAAIQIQNDLVPLGETFPLDKRLQMDERLAAIYLSTSSDEGRSAAEDIVTGLLSQKIADFTNHPTDRVHAGRESRLHCMLSRIEFEREDFEQAFAAAKQAAYLWMQHGQLNDVERNLVQEAACLGRKAGACLPIEMEGETFAFARIVTEILGSSTHTPPPTPPPLAMGHDPPAPPPPSHEISPPSPRQPVPSTTGPAPDPHGLHSPATENPETGGRGVASPRTGVTGPPNGSAPELNKALLLACTKGDAAAVRSLLSRGADVGAHDDQGYTGLHFCASEREGTADVARALLEQNSIHYLAMIGNGDDNNGAPTGPPPLPPLDVNALTRYGRAAVHLAAKSGKADMLRVLLRHRHHNHNHHFHTGTSGGAAAAADPNMRSAVEGWTPLRVALAEMPRNQGTNNKKLQRVCKMLIDNGADPEDKCLDKPSRQLLKEMNLLQLNGPNGSAAQSSSPGMRRATTTTATPVQFSTVDYSDQQQPQLPPCKVCGSHGGGGGGEAANSGASLRSRTASTATSKSTSSKLSFLSRMKSKV